VDYSRSREWVVVVFLLKKIGKAVPLQARSGPEASRKLRFPDFMTKAQDGGKVVSLTHRPPSPPRKYTWYTFLLVFLLVRPNLPMLFPIVYMI
jgi:hypothetical protein